MRKYIGIDLGRIIFACLIPLLHISFSSFGINIVRQYVSRLGVPFFFAVSGMFLSVSVEKIGGTSALKRYSKRIGKLLLIWLLIYFPIMFLRKEIDSFNVLLFKTPAYLWYLTSLLVASVPFCLVKNRKVLFYASVVLYVFGTVFGESYKWLIGGFPLYERFFITTRNGVFFALPIMCVGELVWKREKRSILRLIVYSVLLIAEITFVGINASPLDDRSMYLFLPLFVYELLICLRQWNPNVNTTHFGLISSAIYLMQFGIIVVIMKFGEIIGVGVPWIQVITWLCVCVVPILFCILFKNKKIVKILF